MIFFLTFMDAFLFSLTLNKTKKETQLLRINTITTPKNCFAVSVNIYAKREKKNMKIYHLQNYS